MNVNNFSCEHLLRAKVPTEKECSVDCVKLTKAIGMSNSHMTDSDMQ